MIYKFTCGNKKRNICNRILFIVSNIIIALFMSVWAIALYIVIIQCIAKIIDGVLLEIIERVVIYALIVILLVAAVLPCFPQKAVIKNNCIYIYRNNLFLCRIFRGFYDKIAINKIETIIKPPKSHPSMFEPIPVILINWDYMVEIVTERGNIFYLQIENSDDFINEVKKRQNMIENNHTFEAKASPNMFQFDLQRGYMPDCDEIVLGVNGVDFKTDKATAGLINVKSISYNDIQLCKKSDKHSINGVDSDNIVKITTANQTYYIPIKNPYDFINELYKKLNTCNQ